MKRMNNENTNPVCPHKPDRGTISVWMIVSCMLLMALLHVTGAYAASFDCKKAKLAAEKAICSDSVLSELDDNIAQAHKEALAKLTPFWKEWYTEQQLAWLSKRNKTVRQQLETLHRQRLAEIRAMLKDLPRHDWQVLVLPKLYDLQYGPGAVADGREYIGVARETSVKPYKVTVSYIDVETGVESEHRSTETNPNIGLNVIPVQNGSVAHLYLPSNSTCWRDLEDTGIIVDNGDRNKTASETIPKMRQSHIYSWAKILKLPNLTNLREYFLVYLSASKPYPREGGNCPPVSVMPFGWIAPIKQGAIIQTWDSRVFMKITDPRAIRRGFIAPHVFALDEYDYERYEKVKDNRCEEDSDYKELDIVYNECRAGIIREIIGKEKK